MKPQKNAPETSEEAVYEELYRSGVSPEPDEALTAETGVAVVRATSIQAAAYEAIANEPEAHGLVFSENVTVAFWSNREPIFCYILERYAVGDGPLAGKAINFPYYRVKNYQDGFEYYLTESASLVPLAQYVGTSKVLRIVWQGTVPGKNGKNDANVYSIQAYDVAN